MHIITSDWGKYKLNKINNSMILLKIYEKLKEQNCGFKNNLDCLIDAYKENRIYGIEIEETDKMFERHATNDNIFIEGGFLQLYCFISYRIINRKRCCDMIWVDERLRNKGIAKFMLTQLKIKKTYDIVPEANEFWKYMKIKDIKDEINQKKDKDKDNLKIQFYNSL